MTGRVPPSPSPTEIRLRGLRRLSSSAGILLVLESLALGTILLANGHRLLLPVTVHFPGAIPGGTGERTTLTAVDCGAAVVVLCVLVGIARFAVVPARIFRRYAAALERNLHTARWTEFAFTSSITVFLVAQLNGITEIGALVLIYATTTAMSLFAIVQERNPITRGHPLLALCFGAAIGIVPWGVIAFHQVASGIVGAGPSVMVRVVTILMLSAAFAFAVTQWRAQRRTAAGGDPVAGERTHILLGVISTSLFAWTVVVGIVTMA